MLFAKFSSRYNQKLFQVVHIEPHRFEAWHQNSKDCTSSSEMDHLWTNAGIQTCNALACMQFGSLCEKGFWIVWCHHGRAWDSWVEGVSKCLLLHNGPTDICPAVQSNTCGTCKEATKNITHETLPKHWRDKATVHIKRHEETTSPETLPHLHSSIACHETTEATCFQNVFGDVRTALELLLLVELCGKLDVLKRGDCKDFWNCCYCAC